MPKFKLIKNLESNLKKIENQKTNNFISCWYKNFRIKEISKRIAELKNSIKKK